MKTLKLTFIFILLWLGIYFLTALLIVLVFQQSYVEVVTNPFFIVIGGITNVCITGEIVNQLSKEIN